MRKLKQMPKFIFFCFGFSCIFCGAFSTQAQTTLKSEKDLCEETRILLTSSEPLTFTFSDIEKLPQCFDGRFVRIAGVYRSVFENSDFYDPMGKASAWLAFDPFYPAIKRCSPPNALKLLNRDAGATFGVIALGILKTNGRFGHMRGWKNEFQIICLDEIKDFSKSGAVFQYQTPQVQKQILEWYSKKREIKEKG
jgi:hypothetical protein